MPALESLYDEMYELTRGRCGCEGTGQHGCGCCATFHCIAAAQFAKEKYGVELTPTGHPVMFMGATGCVVPPHLRPICTLHACTVTWGSGEFAGDPERTDKYKALKLEILSRARSERKFPFLERN
jgi:hypothetical protein